MRASFGASSASTIAAAQRRMPSGLCSMSQMRWMVRSIWIWAKTLPEKPLRLQCTRPSCRMRAKPRRRMESLAAASRTEHLQPKAVTTLDRLRQIHARPLFDLLKQARAVYEEHWKNDEIQLCTLLSIKTGGERGDCGYWRPGDR